LASSVRYEGWLFSFSLIIVLIVIRKLEYEKASLALISIASAIGLAFPIYWFIYQTDASGNPLNFFSSVNENYESAQGISFLTILKNNYLTRFIHHNLIYVCFPGIFASVYLFLRNSIVRKLVTFILIPFGLLILISFTGRGLPTHNMWRIPELWNLLLIPFTAYFIQNIDQFIKRKKNVNKIFNYKNSALPFLLSILMIYYLIHIYRYTDDKNYFGKEELRIGRYVEDIIKNNPSKNILIEVPDWSFLHIITASNHPDDFYKISDSGDESILRNKIISEGSSLDLGELKEKDISFLLIKSKELKSKVQPNPFFKLRKNFKEWSLYSIR
jgi:hypothetical protein